MIVFDNNFLQISSIVFLAFSSFVSFNSISKYGPELALDKVIRSNIMPSLEGLERSEIRCLFLKAKEVLGPNSVVTETFDRMANSDSLSLFWYCYYE